LRRGVSSIESERTRKALVSRQDEGNYRRKKRSGEKEGLGAS